MGAGLGRVRAVAAGEQPAAEGDGEQRGRGGPAGTGGQGHVGLLAGEAGRRAEGAGWGGRGWALAGGVRVICGDVPGNLNG
ncbi:hypothetical protein GCM10010507_56880 [Streptomyces cinnamoneus]|uniref:Uncharacterized protein n=1 Tax=Streptomyces cinnamoneus TaxID=53446 RepID=A0A918U1P9_STRCJ|nr:hypothetical protein GCM10010507_56880 [Streptomyces cinnamoneus]